jgi:tetratricopeptide (TPR) repeat protein
MRYRLVIGAVCLSVGWVAAQEPLQGPTPLPEERATVEDRPLLQSGVKNSSEEELPGLRLSAEERIEPPAVAVAEISTNSVDIGQVSFLMDTGVQYEDEGEYAEAEKAYLRALAASPGNWKIRFRLSTLYIQMQHFSKAVDLLKTLLEEAPDNSILCNNLAWVYATGGDVKDGKMALRYAREALLDNPFAPSVWNTLAEAYYVCGDYEAALRSSDQAIEHLRAQQNASEADQAAFMAQHTKIQRARDAFQRFQGIDEDP